MAEEHENVDIEDQVTDETPDESGDDIDPVEAKAREMGWVPEDEWEGDPEKWASPREFIYRGQLFDRIKKQSKDLSKYQQEMEQLKQSMKALGEMNKKIAQKERERIMSSLEKQKEEALEEGDSRAVIEIDKKIREAEKLSEEEEETYELDDDKNQSGQDGPPQEILDWVDENPWYKDSVVMRGAADAIAQEYMNKYPGADVNDMISHVNKEIRKEFPEKFGKRKGAKSAIPESQDSSGSKRGKSKAKYSQKDLTDEQLKVGKTLVKAGAFENIQEYVDGLVEIGEIGA